MYCVRRYSIYARSISIRTGYRTRCFASIDRTACVSVILRTSDVLNECLKRTSDNRKVIRDCCFRSGASTDTTSPEIRTTRTHRRTADIETMVSSVSANLASSRISDIPVTRTGDYLRRDISDTFQNVNYLRESNYLVIVFVLIVFVFIIINYFVFLFLSINFVLKLFSFQRNISIWKI